MGTLYSNIFCENCLFKNILMHLSTKLVGIEFFFNTSFRWFTSSWNLGKSETIENIRKSNIELLNCKTIKLLKLEYTPLNVGLW